MRENHVESRTRKGALLEIRTNLRRTRQNAPDAPEVTFSANSLTVTSNQLIKNMNLIRLESFENIERSTDKSQANYLIVIGSNLLNLFEVSVLLGRMKMICN